MHLGGLEIDAAKIANDVIVAAIGAALGWAAKTVIGLRAEREKTRESEELKRRTEAAEARAEESLQMQREAVRQSELDREELRLVQERSRVPFFRPFTGWANYLRPSLHSLVSLDPLNRTIIRQSCPEVEPSSPDGTPIVFLLENFGDGFQTLEMELDGDTVEFTLDFEGYESKKLCYFVYAHVGALHGKDAELIVKFLALAGTKHTHRYQIRRGFRELRRIYP